MRLSRLTEALSIMAVACLALCASCFAQNTNTVLVPTSCATTSGANTGSCANLDKLDESGLAFDSTRFVQFRAKSAPTPAPYHGTQTFTFPSSISPSAITAIQVLVNYEGPVRTTQTWTWQIFDYVNGGFVPIGDNFFAPNTKPWTNLNFNVGGNNLANYVRSSDGQMTLRVLSNNTAGDADIDYEAMTITTTSTPIAQGPAFYVSTAGHDSNPGTRIEPLRTIRHAASIAGPGSTTVAARIPQPRAA
jgi:N-terminal glycosyl-hydrolase-114-associated domain